MTDHLMKRLRGRLVDGTTPEESMLQAADEIERLRAEVLDLHAQVSTLESREVCTVAHDGDVETCGYCQRDALQAQLLEHAEVCKEGPHPLTALRAEVERLTKANSNLVSRAEESAFNAGEITDWRTERIAEMGYEAARLRARVAHMQFYLQWIYNPAGNDICTPKEIAEMGLKEPDRLRPSPGAVPSGEAVR